MVLTGMKWCNLCTSFKLLSSFNNLTSSKDGKQNKCRACTKEYARNNKEKIAARRKKYYEENKEEFHARQKKYREEHKEEITLYSENYRNQNKDTIATKLKKYHQKNKARTPEEVDAAWQKLHPAGLKKCLKCKISKPRDEFHNCGLAADGKQKKCKVCDIGPCRNYRKGTVKFWTLLGLDPNKCIYCQGTKEHIDHIIPETVGGTHDLWNLAPACASCNHQKNRYPLENFLSRLSEENRSYVTSAIELIQSQVGVTRETLDKIGVGSVELIPSTKPMKE